MIGMAHRGRLNVLVNTLGKMPADLFAEFDHTAPEDLPTGDVKYHQGFSSDVTTPGGPVHLTLAFNPSHLEIVNPVVEGSVRARMDRRGDPQGKQVLPVLVHGDAAFAGQGVNQETLALAQTRGYTTGGTVHIVINNQIGFTTTDPRDMRSTLYCTDIVKMIESPVLHVNGDDPEAVVLATQLALEFRMEFRKDVVVDIICFRKLGHNEQDTPSLTQPLMYKKIGQHPGTRKLYADKLAAQGLGETLGDDMVKAYRAAMDAGKHTVDPVLTNFKSKYAVDWTPVPGQEVDRCGRYRHSAGRMEASGRDASPRFRQPCTPHSLVKKVYDDRAAMGRGEHPVDWGMGEHMAFASLVASGYPVRLSGEDCGRGTFTHRHAVIHDQKREKWDEGTYMPLQNVADNQAPFVVIDSILSEEAVLAFRIRLRLQRPQHPGDLGSAVWRLCQRRAGGDRPVHRLGRSEVGPCQRHHADAAARLRRPGPRAQLGAPGALHATGGRHQHAGGAAHHGQPDLPRAAPPDGAQPAQAADHHDAQVAAAQQGCGLAVVRVHQGQLPDGDSGAEPGRLKADKVKRVMACSGKVYYDLVKKREKGRPETWPSCASSSSIRSRTRPLRPNSRSTPMLTEIVWCQDEPQNQGAWFFVQHYIHENMVDGQKLGYSGRAASASPAVGYSHLHQEQQKALVDGAFGKLKGFVLTK